MGRKEEIKYSDCVNIMEDNKKKHFPASHLNMDGYMKPPTQ